MMSFKLTKEERNKINNDIRELTRKPLDAQKLESLRNDLIYNIYVYSREVLVRFDENMNFEKAARYSLNGIRYSVAKAYALSGVVHLQKSRIDKAAKFAEKSIKCAKEIHELRGTVEKVLHS